MEALRKEWRDFYSEILPSLARSRSPAQPKWPVVLDHCFARIILDNTVGEGQERWDRRLSRPAVKNMTREQLETAIELAARIKAGSVDLVELDRRSLALRGKPDMHDGGRTSRSESGDQRVANSELSEVIDKTVMTKRKIADLVDQDDTASSSKKPRTSCGQSTLEFAPALVRADNYPSPPLSEDTSSDVSSILLRINNYPGLTPYRKRLYATLLSVPKGRHTTYAALSDALNSSARAVGNGMRNNPFAPDVPCHRVLASDGSIGGFRGSWGVDGKNAQEKIQLLKREGIKFDSKGKVRGPPYTDLVVRSGSTITCN